MEHTTGPKDEDRRPLRPDTPIELTLYLRAEELVNTPAVQDFIVRIAEEVAVNAVETLRARGQWPDTARKTTTGEARRCARMSLLAPSCCVTGMASR